MKSTRDVIADIKAKTKQCLENRKSANVIIDLLCYSQNDDASVVAAALRALQQAFSRFLITQEMYLESSPPPDSEMTTEDQYACWLQEQYTTTCDSFVEKLGSTNSKIQELALVGVLKFIELEGQNPLQKPKVDEFTFPFTLLQEMVSKLMSHTSNMESLILRLSEVTEHDDLRFFLMKALRLELDKTPVKKRTEMFLSNVLCALENLEFPSDDEAKLNNFLTKPSDQHVQHPKVSSLKEQRKRFTAVWMEFLRSELTPSLYRRVLTKLDEKVIPFLSSPLVLSDFLTQSYNIGGAVSLLALNGLFILISKYNLDYPDFYRKLYSLFEPQVFHVKYRARFFFLADMFLSSIHLPSYLVASFIKRISRLSLSAPPAGARLCVAFVLNLFVRHPNCSVLIHRTDSAQVNSDPFLDDEPDPAKTRAMESSLWEMKTLQNHFSPEVALEAKKINHLPTQEQDLADFLDSNTEQMIEQEVKKKKPNVPLCPDQPKGLFGSSGLMKNFFTL
ncbi:hypothetical protein BaRGS_00034306 [Batillaria attramentaria]|uniref:CCAAT-binding factor domain-containing protein n=1 Tax=Batillaria attramentaria TaxID=370345 RepID=A0ABD0JI75_9CAEN